MIRFITVAREFGSGGLSVSRLIAERLHWRVLDREIVDEVVRMAGVQRETAERCDEALDPVYHRLLKSLWQGGFETSTAGLANYPFDSTEMSRCARVVMETAASKGNCIIVGRGGQCLFRERTDALHVFLWAPRSDRVRRIRQRLPDEPHPEQLMDRVDRARTAFLRSEYNALWCDHRLYDVVLNSGLGDEVVADTIVTAIQAGNRAHGG